MLNLETHLLPKPASYNPKLDYSPCHGSIIVIDPVKLFLFEYFLLLGLILKLLRLVAIFTYLIGILAIRGEIRSQIAHHLLKLLKDFLSVHKKSPGSKDFIDLILYPWFVVFHKEVSESLCNNTICLEVFSVVILFDLNSICIKPLI
jgi:hypothetical protein